eukprot:scaffold2120_cov259-Pinguiococcus_pyrenoidosus.AAC.3
MQLEEVVIGEQTEERGPIQVAAESVNTDPGFHGADRAGRRSPTDGGPPDGSMRPGSAPGSSREGTIPDEFSDLPDILDNWSDLGEFAFAEDSQGPHHTPSEASDGSGFSLRVLLPGAMDRQWIRPENPRDKDGFSTFGRCDPATEVVSSGICMPSQPDFTTAAYEGVLSSGPVTVAGPCEGRTDANLSQVVVDSIRLRQHAVQSSKGLVEHNASHSKDKTSARQYKVVSQVIEEAIRRHTPSNDPEDRRVIKELRVVERLIIQGLENGQRPDAGVASSSTCEDSSHDELDDKGGRRTSSTTMKNSSHGSKRSRSSSAVLSHNKNITLAHARGNKGKVASATMCEADKDAIREMSFQNWPSGEECRLPATGLYVIRMALPDLERKDPKSVTPRTLAWGSVTKAHQNSSNCFDRVYLDSLSSKEECDPGDMEDGMLQGLAEKLAEALCIGHHHGERIIMQIIAQGDVEEIMELIPWDPMDFQGWSSEGGTTSDPNAQSLAISHRTYSFAGTKFRDGGGSRKGRPETRTEAGKLYKEKGFNVALVFCLLFATVDKFFLKFVDLEDCKHSPAVLLAFAMLKNLQERIKQDFRIRLAVMRKSPKRDAVWGIFNKVLSELSHDPAFLRRQDDGSEAPSDGPSSVTKTKAGQKRRKTEAKHSAEAAGIESRAHRNKDDSSEDDGDPYIRAYKVYRQACEAAVRALRNGTPLNSAAAQAWKMPSNEAEQHGRTLSAEFLACFQGGEPHVNTSEASMEGLQNTDTVDEAPAQVWNSPSNPTGAPDRTFEGGFPVCIAGCRRQHEQSHRGFLACNGKHGMKPPGDDSPAPKPKSQGSGSPMADEVFKAGSVANALIYFLFARVADPRNTEDVRALLLAEIVRVLDSHGVEPSADDPFIGGSDLPFAVALDMMAEWSPLFLGDPKGLVDDRLDWLVGHALSVNMPRESPTEWQELLKEVFRLVQAREGFAVVLKRTRSEAGLQPAMRSEFLNDLPTSGEDFAGR